MNINGVELNFDLYDAENADMKKRYYEELNKMQNVNNELPGKGEREDTIYLCNRIKGMFDTVFGEPTGRDVCGDGSNLLTCMDAYEQLVSEQMRQSEKYNAIMAKVKGIKKK